MTPLTVNMNGANDVRRRSCIFVTLSTRLRHTDTLTNDLIFVMLLTRLRHTDTLTNDLIFMML